MNKQKAPKGIEWTRIRLNETTELPGYTWNPTGGCKHGCTWQMPDGSITECYAKTIAERFTQAFPQGFDTHYWREHMLEQPLKLKTPAGIFVGSMADLFGHWVPREQICKILDVMKQANWHIFQILSKFPNRLSDFNPYPDNVWVGVSVPAGHLMSQTGGARALKAYLGHMTKIEAKTRFMSIEPLWFDVAPIFEEWITENKKLPMEWVIIGAASNGTAIYQPEPEWTQKLLDILGDQKIPVFFKGNIEWSEFDWRDSFPVFYL